MALLRDWSVEKIKTHLTTAYMMFVFDFHDPSSVDLEINFDIALLFDNQKSADSAKKLWGKNGFKKLLSLYFNRYQTGHGLDVDALSETVTRNKKVLLRHLGKDKVAFLVLIVTLFRAMDFNAPKRGLLFERTSA